VSITGAANYHDFQGLSALRNQASNNPNAAIEEVASQFESLFTQMMLKSMREASAPLEGGLFKSNQMDTYQGMFDQQIALDLSSQKSLGLADILVRDFGGKSEPKETAELHALPERTANFQSDLSRHMLLNSATGDDVAALYETSSSGESQPLGIDAKADWRPSTPDQFIRDIWEHAVAAGEKIGVDPALLVAQSALETGWGKKVMQAPDGRSSHNLFGIKASPSWEGPSTVVRSLEYRDGMAELEQSRFRVYDSLASSFNDYVSFLTGNPRYEQALGKVADSREFVNELQDAGYATDPAYAEKIMDIVGRTSYESVVDELKNFSSASL
jgi:flagellar protein FlgJ